MQNIILASGNSGKLRELQATLAGHALVLLPQSHFGVKDAAETGLTFVENALIKARHASLVTGLPAIADDSGLEVDALGGAPGIYSARYAGVSSGNIDAANNRKLLQALNNVAKADRSARFQCVIVYLRHARDPIPLICQGSWEGRILLAETGTHGFGYDPLFYVPTHDCSSAELAPEIKNQLSHRGKAIRQLLACWNSRP